MALKESNGSRQARHDHSDLHGVEPNRLICLVLVEPHRGQRAARVRATGPELHAPGGAIP